MAGGVQKKRPAPTRPAVLSAAVGENEAATGATGVAATAAVEVAALSPRSVEGHRLAQLQFLQRLLALPLRFGLELRWQAARGGRVALYMVLRCEGPTRQVARRQVLDATEALKRVAAYGLPDHVLAPITSTVVLRGLLRVGARSEVGEIRRTELAVTAFDMTSTISGPAFLDPSADEMLVRTLARQPCGTALVVGLKAVGEYDASRIMLAEQLLSLESAAQRTELELAEGSRSVARGDRSPLFKLRTAQAVSAHRLAEFGILARTRATLVGPGPIDPFLIGAARSAFGGPGTTTWVPAVEPPEIVAALDNLTTGGFKPWGLYGPQQDATEALLYVASLEEATAWFRMPLARRSLPLVARVVDPPAVRASDKVPSTGVVLGRGTSFEGERSVALEPTMRTRHMYIVGATGGGKSTLLQNMAVDLASASSRHSVVIEDPHGPLVEALASNLPASVKDRVVVFDPTDPDCPSLNPFDVKTPRERAFVKAELIGLFRRLFSEEFTGPRWAAVFRSAAELLMVGPEPGSLADVARLFYDDAFRENRLRHVADPSALLFWREEWKSLSDYHKGELVSWFVAKFSAFASDEYMQRATSGRATLDLAEIMADGRVLLVRLPKGELGDDNVSILGTLLVIRLQSAAAARFSVAPEGRTPVTVILDEAQSFVGSSMETLLAEARKADVSMVLANQCFGQLSRTQRDVILGNVGTIVAFRVGRPDAEMLEPSYAPYFSAAGLTELETGRAAVRTVLADGSVAVFDVQTRRPPVTPDGAPRLRDFSTMASTELTGSNDREHSDRVPTVAELISRLDAGEA